MTHTLFSPAVVALTFKGNGMQMKQVFYVCSRSAGNNRSSRRRGWRCIQKHKHIMGPQRNYDMMLIFNGDLISTTRSIQQRRRITATPRPGGVLLGAGCGDDDQSRTYVPDLQVLEESFRRYLVQEHKVLDAHLWLGCHVLREELSMYISFICISAVCARTMS